MIRCLATAAVSFLGLCASALAQDADPSSGTASDLAQLPVHSVGEVQAVSGSSQADAHAGALLFDNGPFRTGIGDGFGGADTSAVQAGFFNFGYGLQQAANLRLADDFTVGQDRIWQLSELSWHAYKVNPATLSPFISCNVRIWSGAPDAGGIVVAGDTSTNRLSSSAFSNIYRVTPLTLTNDQRPLMECTIDLSWVPRLLPGTYWIDVQMDTTTGPGVGPFSPPTVPQAVTDNALQSQGGVWVRVIDPSAMLQQDFPFKLYGSAAEAATYCSAKPTSNGCLPSIAWTGSPSASAVSGFVIQGSSFMNNQSCLLLYSTTGQAADPFMGGTLCLRGPIKRTLVSHTGGNPPPVDCSGTTSFDMNAFAAGALGGAPLPSLRVPGTVVYCQWWGRDPGFSAPNNVQLSDGLGYLIYP